MPGSSLWLIPPSDDNPFNKSLQELITDTLPSDFPDAPKHPFIPHVTISSDIEPAETYASSSPQQWLDNLSLPHTLKKEVNEVIIELETLEAGEPFFKKCTLQAGKDTNLLHLAATCRQQCIPRLSEHQAQTWAETEYLPHLSLFYGDVPVAEVRRKLPMIETQLGFEIGSLFDCCGGSLAMGARLVLVDTAKDIEEWRVMAQRECPWVVWRMAKGLV